MLIHAGILLESKSSAYRTFENQYFKVIYKGFIFTEGRESEEDSLSEILSHLREKGFINFGAIRGNYFIYIIDLSSKEKYAFIDNSGMYKVFIFKNIISTSFLDLIEHINISKIDLNFRAISEFLHFGFVSFSDTFLNEVRKLNKNDLIVWQGQDLIVNKKNLAELTTVSNVRSFEHFFNSLRRVVQNKNISIDLTGGIDSRLICGFMSYLNVDFEVAIYSVNESSDLKIAKTIAGILGKELYVTFPSAAGITEDELLKIFTLSDSQIDILSYQSAFLLNNARKARNIDLQLSGVGGELFKDFWWLQDFPFYKNPNSNIERLYNLRIESLSFPHNILGENVKSHSLNTKIDQIRKLELLRMPFNTQTYDSIYYNYKMETNAGTYVTIANDNYFIAYAPLLERELVKIGFNLNRTDRFFSKFHRKQMSICCPSIAKIRTTENISCSNETKEMLKDIFRYISDKNKRFAKQVLRKITNKTYFQDTNVTIKMYEKIKAMDIFKQQEEVLKEFQVINEDVEIVNLPYNLLGRVLTVGLFLKKMKS